MIDFTVYLIAISLVIDCFAVSICISGIKKLFRNSLAFCFLPEHYDYNGFYIGITFLNLVKNHGSIDPWHDNAMEYGS
jgi:hypothetical protein